MHRILISVICAIAFLAPSAQLAKWTIHPNYDSVRLRSDQPMVMTDSADTHILWSLDGVRLFSTEDNINNFREGLSVITTKDGLAVGFINPKGKFTELPRLKVAYDFPYFSDGYLALFNAQGFTEYYNTDGVLATFPTVVSSYPFHHGYTPIFTYDNMEKNKDPHFAYMTDKGEIVELYLNGKVVDPKNVQLCSAITNDDRGIVIIKNKVYWFDAKTRQLTPMERDNAEAKKKQLSLEGNYDDTFNNFIPGNSIVLNAKYGKKNTALLVFNNELIPERVNFGEGQELTFPAQVETRLEFDSPLRGYYSSGKYGVKIIDADELLPPQFDAVGGVDERYEDNIFVKHNGHWGVVRMMPDDKVSYTLNKDKPISFRHQKVESNLQVKVPVTYNTDLVQVETPSKKIVLKYEGREDKDTRVGNLVTFPCDLYMPDSLPDQVTEILYSPINLTIDGIRFFGDTIHANGWFYKRYNVDLMDTETTVSNGVVSFTINVTIDKQIGEDDYPFDIFMEADSVNVYSEKLSQTRYKYTLTNLKEDVNNLNVVITETGCPPMGFPFEIYYKKPEPKKKEKETVTVRKKQVVKPQEPMLPF